MLFIKFLNKFLNYNRLSNTCLTLQNTQVAIIFTLFHSFKTNFAIVLMLASVCQIIIQNTNIVSSPQMLRILSRSGCLGA